MTASIAPSSFPLGRFLLFAFAGALLVIGLRSRTVDETQASDTHDRAMHDMSGPDDERPSTERRSPPKEGTTTPSHSAPHTEQPTAPTPTEPAPPTTDPDGVLLDLGNDSCPVMGGHPDGVTHTDWNGLRVGHCCAGCTERFLKNPESLLDEVSPGWRDALAAARAIDAASGAEQQALLDEAAEQWAVLRRPHEHD